MSSFSVDFFTDAGPLIKTVHPLLNHMPSLAGLFKLARPHQWLKNVLVFAGLLFSESWHDAALAGAAFKAFAAFCCLSSTVYIFNDLHDRLADARHPVKRLRPLASGQVSVAAAAALCLVLLLAGLALASGNLPLLALLALYLALNLAYSLRLKQVPVVDVSLLAFGLVLRLLAGTLAIGIAPSRWLLLTGIFVALFLGFSKRKAESFHQLSSQRSVMAFYPAALLDTFMSVSMTATITTYSLFATSPEALARHSDRLIYTVPLVIFALLRYTYQVHQGLGEDVSRDLLRDPWIVASAGAWMLVFWAPL